MRSLISPVGSRVIDSNIFPAYAPGTIDLSQNPIVPPAICDLVRFFRARHNCRAVISKTVTKSRSLANYIRFSRGEEDKHYYYHYDEIIAAD